MVIYWFYKLKFGENVLYIELELLVLEYNFKFLCVYKKK